MTAHSKIGASSMKRWSACPGSVRLSRDIESRSSAFAEEGTLAHAVAEAWLTNGEQSLDQPFSYDDHGVTKTVTLEKEMLDHLAHYVDAVFSRWDNVKAHLLVEQRFHLHELHSDLFGTSDAIVWQPEIRRLSVLDLKYGAGVPVEVNDNPQLMYYGLGALLANPQWKPVEVEVVIAQPRCPHSEGPVRAQVLQVVDLIDFAGELVDAVKRTENASDEFGRIADWDEQHLNAGDHCRWCPAAGLPCPRLEARAQETARNAFAPGLPYDGAKLAETLEWLPILEAWIKNVREFAYAEAEKGNGIPRHKLVEKRATAKLKEGAITRLAEALGVPAVELFKDPEPLGITEIRAKAPGKNAKERDAFLEPFVVKESSGHTLVHESDRRDAIKVDAKSAFTGV